MKKPVNVPRVPYTLGVDLGSSSIGWALVGLNSEAKPVGLLKAGVRVFDPGVAGTELDIQKGKDGSKAADRRATRLQRRQLRRRAARKRDLFEVLQQNGLLPPYPQRIAGGAPHNISINKSAARHEILAGLDAELYAKWKARLDAAQLPAASHVLSYFLRAAALEEALEPFELGRVFYQLCQRRGFKSNRREVSKTDEEEKEKGKVYAGIDELSRAKGSQTLGQFFARVDPLQSRIRGRWTARSMFETEFEQIWSAQRGHHPSVLTPRLKTKVWHLLFFQRPIAAQSHLVGKCELERTRKRAPMACLEAQRFRLLQKVNDLRLVMPDYTERDISAEQRATLLRELEEAGDLSFNAIRQLFGLPKRGIRFNLERGGEKKLPGNRTKRAMLGAFGQRWSEFSGERQKLIVEDWRTAETDGWLLQRGMQRWGLDEEHARQWANEKPEDGYSRLSRRAIARLLPLMEQGLSFKQAEKQVYGAGFSGGRVFPLLPAVREVLPSLRNPAVERALTELRKVVNAILRAYGKPVEIHVELARDLKRSRKDRQEMWKSFRERQVSRERLAAEITKKTGIPSPSRADIEKALLWEECGGICPYTCRSIDFAALFGDSPQFDVEHILPLSRCPDDSFANKTLCCLQENRHVKQGRTPWEAYGAAPQKWEGILERVRRFNNPAKLKRFQVKSSEELAEFSSRQLNDTRYSSKLAAEYLGVLYGGRDVRLSDGSSRRAIHASPGGLTAMLRRNWGLEAILREPEAAKDEPKAGKPRTDHRHHAIDAIVIALSTPSAVKALSDAAERNSARGRESFKGVEAPWSNFVPAIRPHIEQLVVSHRPEHKLSGPLHDETLYGKPSIKGGKAYVHVRRPVESLSRGEIEEIVDDAVRAAVEARLSELGDLKELKAAGASPPYLKAKDGTMVPVRRVRIRKALATRTVSKGLRLRNVAPNNNHHMEVVAQLDERGKEIRWDGAAVTLLEAQQRRRDGQPVVKRDHGNGWLFKFSLMGGDVVEVTENGVAQLYVVRTIASNGQISLARINDARLKKEMQEASAWWSPRAEAIRKLHARKMMVDLLGQAHCAND